MFSIPFSYFLSIFLEFPLSVLYSIVMLKLDWEFCLRNNRFYQKISAYRILLQESAEKKLLENISKSIFFFYLLYTWLKWSVILYKDAEKNRALFEVKFMGGHMWKSGQMTPKTLSKWGFWAFSAKILISTYWVGMIQSPDWIGYVIQEGKKVGIETLEINPYIEFGHSK